MARKNISKKRDLIHCIKTDTINIAYSIILLKKITVHQLLKKFFAGHQGGIPSMLKGAHKKHLDHIGLEIHEPLDIFLQGINRGTGKIKKILGMDIMTTKSKRFPASLAFQKHVNAKAQILRLWLRIEQHEIMLELYDIDRPVGFFDQKGNGSAREIDAKKWSDGERKRFFSGKSLEPPLSAGGAIWHYAVYVDSIAKVRELHDYFAEMACTNSAYAMPFQAIVHNPCDSSLYTKVINKAQNLEMEFVTKFEGQGIGHILGKAAIS